MSTEMGEYLVGAYLQMIEKCDFVIYNVRHPGGKLKGLDEIDVIGMKPDKGVVYLCEVATHIQGLLYGGSYAYTVNKIRNKLQKQRAYAREHFPNYQERHFMFWSPRVSKGIAKELKKIPKLELMIDENYTKRIDLLKNAAKKLSHDSGNPAFRLLQILEHTRKPQSIP